MSMATCSCRACEYNRDQRLKLALTAESEAGTVGANEMLASLETEVQERQDWRQEQEKSGVKPDYWVVMVDGLKIVKYDICELNMDLLAERLNHNAVNYGDGYWMFWVEKY